MGRKLRIGLIGMGRIGKLHGSNIQNLVKDAEIVLAADPYLNDQTLKWAQFFQRAASSLQNRPGSSWSGTMMHSSRKSAGLSGRY